MDPVRLTALGLETDHTERDGSLLRRGVHLRWLLGPTVNYPDDGFEIWRRRYRPLGEQERSCWRTDSPLPGELARTGGDPFVPGRLVPSGERGILVDDGRDIDLAFPSRSAWRVEIRYSGLGGGRIDAAARAYSGVVLDRKQREFPPSGRLARLACEWLRKLEPPCARCCDCLHFDPRRERDPSLARVADDEWDRRRGKACRCDCRCGESRRETAPHRERDRKRREAEWKRRADRLRARPAVRPLPREFLADLDPPARPDPAGRGDRIEPRAALAGDTVAGPGAPATERLEAPAGTAASEEDGGRDAPRLDPPPVGLQDFETRQREPVLHTRSPSGFLRSAGALVRILYCWLRLALYGFLYTILCFLCRRGTGGDEVHAGTLVLEGGGIRELEIRGERLAVHEICYHARDPVKEKWRRVGQVDWPTSEAEVASRIAGEALPAYLASEWADPAARTALLDQLAELRAAPSMWDHERTDSGPGNGPDFTWNPWRMLQAAAIAPHIARLLGLGFIDRGAAAGERYDYRVVSANDAAVASEHHDVRLEPYRELDAVEGIIAEPVEVPGVGRIGWVGLRWDDPDSMAPEIDRPVAYHVYSADLGFTPPAADPSTGDMDWLTSGAPVRVDPDPPAGAFRFRDPGAYEGWAAWRVAAVDLFGRHGAIDEAIRANLAKISAPGTPAAVTARVLLDGDPDLTAAESAEATPAPGTLELTWQWGDAAYNPRAHETLEFYPVLHQGGFDAVSLQALSLDDEGAVARVTTTAALGAAVRGAWAWLVIHGKRWRVERTAGDEVWILPEMAPPLPGDDEPQRLYPDLSVPTDARLVPNPAFAGWWSRHLAGRRVAQRPRLTLRANQVGSDGSARSIETDVPAAAYTEETRLGTIVVRDADAVLRYRIVEREPDAAGSLRFRIEPLDAAAESFGFAADQTCEWYPGYRQLIPLDAGELPFPVADITAQGLLAARCSVVAENRSTVVAGTRLGPAGAPATALWRKFDRPDAPAVDAISLSWATRPDHHGFSEFTVEWTPRPGEKYLVYRATDAGLLEADLAVRFREGLGAARADGTLDPGAIRDWLADSARDGTADIEALRAGAADFAGGAGLDGGLAEWLLTQAKKRSAALPEHGRLAAVLEAARAERDDALDTDRAAVLLGLAARDDLLDAWAPITARAVEGARYTDSFPGRASNWLFYRVRGVDAAQNRSPTLSAPIGPVALLDTTPPRAPTLVWTGEDNRIRFEWRDTEPGIVRYRIFRTQDPERAADWRLMGPPVVDVDGRARRASDRIPQGTTWYYKIVATREIVYEKAGVERTLRIDSRDARFVEAVTFSRTPPPPPAWRGHRMLQRGIELTIGFGEEHAEYMVQRRAAGARTWASLTPWTPVADAEIAFRDEDLPGRGRYFYRVQVKNRAGIVNATDDVHVYYHE